MFALFYARFSFFYSSFTYTHLSCLDSLCFSAFCCLLFVTKATGGHTICSRSYFHSRDATYGGAVQALPSLEHQIHFFMIPEYTFLYDCWKVFLMRLFSYLKPCNITCFTFKPASHFVSFGFTSIKIRETVLKLLISHNVNCLRLAQRW